MTELEPESTQLEQNADFDLDAVRLEDLEMPHRDQPPYDLSYLNTILNTPALLPPGCKAERINKDYKYGMDGCADPIRVTTDPTYYELQNTSVELWSLGSPSFPKKKKSQNGNT